MLFCVGINHAVHVVIHFSLSQTACLVITILLYCAFTSTFSWMLVEAIHLFRMIVLVFGIDRSLKALYHCIGWGNYSYWCNFVVNYILRNDVTYKGNTYRKTIFLYLPKL